MKLFALLILIGSATANLRDKISQQQALSVDAAPEDGGVELLYIRHGESKGNGASVEASVRLLQYINTHTHTHTLTAQHAPTLAVCLCTQNSGLRRFE